MLQAKACSIEKVPAITPNSCNRNGLGIHEHKRRLLICLIYSPGHAVLIAQIAEIHTKFLPGKGGMIELNGLL